MHRRGNPTGWRGPRPISAPRGFRRVVGRSNSASSPTTSGRRRPAAQKEDSARQAELSMLQLVDPEPEPEPELEPFQRDKPAVVRRSMIVGPPAAGRRKKRRRKANKTRGRRGATSDANRLPRIEGPFLGSVVIQEDPETRLLARREQRKVIEAKRPWRQPMPPIAKPSPRAAVQRGSFRAGFGSSSGARKVAFPAPGTSPRSQPAGGARHTPLPPKAPMSQRSAPRRHKQVDHGLPYISKIKQIMTAKKLFAKLKQLNSLARENFAGSDMRVLNARSAAQIATETVKRLEGSTRQLQAEVEAAQEELARQEAEAWQAQIKMAREVAEAEAAEEAVSRQVQDAKDAEAHATATEVEARAAAAEALRGKTCAAEAQLAAAAAAQQAAESEAEAARAQAEQVAAEQALVEAERLVERGVSSATGKKFNKQEKRVAAADLAAKREHLLQRAPSVSITNDQTQWHEVQLRRAEKWLNSSSKTQRKELVADVARKQAALQKERSAGVRWALEQAEIARSWAETSREQMELELQAADTAWTVAAQQETAAVSARQLATTELEEARAAQLAAVAEREEAAATGVAAKMEAEDLEHARAILDLQVAQHATSQTALAQAQSEALRLEQLAKDLAEHSYPPSLLDPDDVISSYVNEDVEPCREDDLDDDRPVAAMRSFVVELLDERLEQLYLPEDEPAVFVKIQCTLRCCIERCQEAIAMLGFDATVQHPTWSHQIDMARADFKRMCTLCEKKMINGLLLLANQQLSERCDGSSRALQDCIAGCDEALLLCGGEGEHEMTEGIGTGADLSQPHSDSEPMRRFRNWRRAQIEGCRKLAVRQSQAVALDEAVLLNPEGVGEAASCSDNDEARNSDQERVSEPHVAASGRQAETDSAVDVDAASHAAPVAVDAMAQGVSRGLGAALDDAPAQHIAQLSDGGGREYQKKSDHEWQVQQNANAIEDYKHQVAGLREALRKQAEDAQHTLRFVADTAAQMERLEESLQAAQEQVSALEKERTGELLAADANGSASAERLAAAAELLAQERAKSQALEEANEELREQLATALSHLDQERGLTLRRK